MDRYSGHLSAYSAQTFVLLHSFCYLFGRDGNFFMDIAEEISRQLVQNKGTGRIERVGIISQVKSTSRFLPTPSMFYKYVRQRIEMFVGDPSYTINTGQTDQIQMYCGLVVHTQNAYFLLFIHQDLSGEMVKLDLSELADYSIYSGQIAKVLGVNPIGEQIVVDSMVYDLVVDSLMKPEKKTVFTLSVINGSRVERAEKEQKEEKEERTEQKEEKEVEYSQNQNSLGSSDNPICDMIRKCTSDAVIVIGDISTEEREEYKKLSITRKIRIICMPAHDGMSSTVSYPCEFIRRVSAVDIPSSSSNNQARKIYEIGNSLFIEVQSPSMISIDGVLIGVTSIDMLLGISRKEISRNRKRRMLDIVQHAVCQNTFLPFVPHDIPVDYSAHSAFIWPYRPDLLIFPTLLSAPIEEVCETHAIPVNRERMDFRIESSADGIVRVDRIY